MAFTQEDQYNQSYYEQRMQLLGITAEANQIGIWQNEDGQNIQKPLPIFREGDKGIDILVYTLDRTIIQVKPDGSRWSKPYCLTRLKETRTRPDGTTQKYHIPKGQGTYPFFHPSLIEAFEKQTPIHTLFLTEGFFKAFKGTMHGIPTIGLSSITHMKDKDSGNLHTDILKFIKYCSVKRVVWLTDGDCLDITSKDLTDGIDLYKRPRNFYSSCETFKQLLDDTDVDKYFFHVNTDALFDAHKDTIEKPNLKGLDDILIHLPQATEAIVADALSVNTGHYFIKMPLNTGTNKIYKYFHLYDVNEFYNYHVERRPDLKGIEFKFNGTTYKWNEEENTCKIVVPGESRNYCRVGTAYYKFIQVPNKYGQVERQLANWDKPTIKDDHGPKFLTHIAKYQSFCNVPDHINYQQVVHNCFNLYNPLDFLPLEEETTEAECQNILNFIKHIFGEGSVTFTDPKTQKKQTYNMQQLALDYCQLIYQKPTQKLPILCLVSKENNTGKSTLGKLLKVILGGNCAVVGNQDLAGDFNRHWATKSLVICDETKIDKQVVIEKVKNLSTADKIMINAKGKDHVEIDCFLKFIFITNNEENFINITDDDIRYWVIKVPTIKTEDPDMLDKMIEEIPAFLTYLNKRKLTTERLNRMWFHPTLLRTKALDKVIQNSKPMVVKELRQYFKDAFKDFGVTEIRMSLGDIHAEVFKNSSKFEKSYIETILKDQIKVPQFVKYEYAGKNYNTWAEALEALNANHPTPVDELEAERQIKTKYVTSRYDYPRWEMQFESGKPTERKLIFVKSNGRPYIFTQSMFLTPEEIATIQVDPEIEQLTTSTHPGWKPMETENVLPFS